MNVRLVDVARAAGVSRSTAGRALSGHPAVLEETRQAVLVAAASLGYRVDPAARALRGGSSRLLGLVVTNLLNASIQRVAERVHERAHDHGYQVLMAVTNGDGPRERELIDALVDHRIAGLLVMPSDSPGQCNRLKADGLPVVAMIRRPAGLKVSAVLNDDRAGARTATDYLLGQGHRSIGFIGGPDTVHSGRERFRGFCQALDAAGVARDPALIRRGPFDADWGAQAGGSLLEGTAPCSAVVVANHEALFGVVQLLAQRGVDVPSDLSLVGFEDAPLFRYWHPSITVVDTHPGAIADAGFTILLEQLDQGDTACKQVTVPAALVVRASCAHPLIVRGGVVVGDTVIPGEPPAPGPPPP